jgi:hypothetical protein
VFPPDGQLLQTFEALEAQCSPRVPFNGQKDTEPSPQTHTPDAPGVATEKGGRAAGQAAAAGPTAGPAELRLKPCGGEAAAAKGAQGETGEATPAAAGAEGCQTAAAGGGW